MASVKLVVMENRGVYTYDSSYLRMYIPDMNDSLVRTLNLLQVDMGNNLSLEKLQEENVKMCAIQSIRSHLLPKYPV